MHFVSNIEPNFPVVPLLIPVGTSRANAPSSLLGLDPVQVCLKNRFITPVGVVVIRRKLFFVMCSYLSYSMNFLISAVIVYQVKQAEGCC